MTTIFDSPQDFAEDQLSGFVDLYSDRLIQVPGGVVGFKSTRAQVAVIVGGGSGHYPAFAGLVGPGFASGAVVGNIFTSPSAAQVYSVAKAADQGKGVILTFGNYAGDVMNFGIAAKRLRQEGIDTRIVLVTDDVASATQASQRRGIAGDFAVFKAMGAAARRGAGIDEVERLGNLANDHTRTIGVAFSGCTMPGAQKALFQVPSGHMSLGLGIHGEPGIRDIPRSTATELANILVTELLAAAPETPTRRVGVILNGLGTTKYEELFLLWSRIAPMLREHGLEIVEPEVGELVTSLDMGGCSLTLTWLTEELELLWSAPANTPAFRKGDESLVGLRPPTLGALDAQALDIGSPSDAAVAFGQSVRFALRTAQKTIHEHEVMLGQLDAVAGDGDHGRGMVRGVDAAVAAIAEVNEAGPRWLLKSAGRAWAAHAGGTSGVLWGAGLEAMAEVFGDHREHYGSETLVDGIEAFVQAIQQLGGADLGDKTLLDVAIPFYQALRANAQPEIGQAAFQAAVTIAVEAAQQSASLTPRKGRARPLAARSIGTPDPGAVSLSLIIQAISDATSQK